MEVAARDPWDELAEAEQQARAAHAKRLDAIARLDQERPDDPCIPDLSCELARELGWSQFTASERIRTAAALRDLPEVDRAQRQGRLSENQLRWVSRFATPETDHQWAGRAPHMTPNRLKLEWERQVRRTREQAEDDHATRSLRMGWNEDRSRLAAEMDLPAEQGAAFEEAVRDASRPPPTWRPGRARLRGTKRPAAVVP